MISIVIERLSSMRAPSVLELVVLLSHIAPVLAIVVMTSIDVPLPRLIEPELVLVGQVFGLRDQWRPLFKLSVHFELLVQLG